MIHGQITAFDTETGLIRPGCQVPPLACVTWQTPGQPPRIATPQDARPVVESWLRDGNIMVGHNIAYDTAVACEAWPELRPAIFAAYANDRVTDTMLRQQLLDIAAGCYRGRLVRDDVWIAYLYDLQSVAKRVAGISIAKDGWRYSYGRFIGLPLAAWPERARELQAEARARLDAGGLDDETREHCESIVASDASRCVDYPLDDARATLAIYQAQEAHAAYLVDQYRQARGAFALHLSSAYGLRTDAEGVAVLERETAAALADVEAGLQSAGLVRADGTRDTKRARVRMFEVCRAEGLELRRTKGHSEKDPEKSKCRGVDGAKLPPGHADCVEHVCLDADACSVVDDPILSDYAEASTLKKVLGNDVKVLLAGSVYPVHTRYGLAETGRTTSSKPNIQNFRRYPGIREAFRPRPLHVYYQADYPQLELYTLAQCCLSWLGESALAAALNAGLDPHTAMAAVMIGGTYDEAAAAIARCDAGTASRADEDVADMRQLAKPTNFGLPGGMGPPKLLITIKRQLGAANPALLKRLEARGFLTPERAEWLREQWRKTWPEMARYQARAAAMVANPSERATVRTLFTNRVRGGAKYCAACNTGFQALGADIAKEAAWRIAHAQYVEPESPLFNARTVAFLHDEFIGECRDDSNAHDVAHAQADLMAAAAAHYLPGVPIARERIKPTLMRVWSKKAKAVHDTKGRLIPWSP